MDLALISDDMFSHTVETVPAFKGKMVLATRQSFEHSPGPLSLDPKKEIRLPWDPEYDLWHDYWFGPRVRPRVDVYKRQLQNKGSGTSSGEDHTQKK